MKIRNGFVSNSSSSSFICEICNRTEIGWDGNSVTDFDMVRCVNDHTFCMSHLINSSEVESMTEVPETSCPICSYEDISYPEIKRFFLATTPFTLDEVMVEIKKINKRRKKVYDNEYVEYVMKALEITSDQLLEELKAKLPLYTDFLKHMRNL